MWPYTRIVLRALKVSYSDVGEGGVAVNCEKTQFFLNTLYMQIVRKEGMDRVREYNLFLKMLCITSTRGFSEFFFVAFFEKDKLSSDKAMKIIQ